MAQEVTTTGRRLERRGNGEATQWGVTYRPHTDIYETEDSVVLVSDMAGVAPGDADVTLDRRLLTIRGRVPSRPREGYRPIYAEYGEGDYERVFTLSEDIDRDGIKATMKEGVLTLVLPKVASAQTKKIKVKRA